MSTEKQAAATAIRAAFDTLREYNLAHPNDELDRRCDLQVAAFKTARELAGWDYEADKNYVDWALSATDEELYHANLECALKALDERYPDPAV